MNYLAVLSCPIWQGNTVQALGQQGSLSQSEREKSQPPITLGPLRLQPGRPGPQFQHHLCGFSLPQVPQSSNIIGNK